jgi:hypothetical protein
MTTGSSVDIVLTSVFLRLAQAKERQDEHDYDNQTNQIDHAVHGSLLESWTCMRHRALAAARTSGEEESSIVVGLATENRRGFERATPLRQTGTLTFDHGRTSDKT